MAENGRATSHNGDVEHAIRETGEETGEDKVMKT